MNTNLFDNEDHNISLFTNIKKGHLYRIKENMGWEVSAKLRVSRNDLVLITDICKADNFGLQISFLFKARKGVVFLLYHEIPRVFGKPFNNSKFKESEYGKLIKGKLYFLNSKISVRSYDRTQCFKIEEGCAITLIDFEEKKLWLEAKILFKDKIYIAETSYYNNPLVYART